MSNPAFPSASSSLPHYFQKAYRYPRLEREEERALVQRYREHGDERAAETLILSHLRYVVIIAAKYRSYQVPFADLVAEGNLGLLTALEKYDLDHNTRFVTYASFWIRAKVVSYVLANWSMAKSGCGPLRSKLFFALRRERARTLSEFGAGPEADAELERRMGFDIAKVKRMLQHLERRDLSLDQRLGHDSDDTLGDLLPAPEQAQNLTVANDQSQRRAEGFVEVALRELDARELFIARERLMADGEEELSLAEIGRQLGVTRERARQLEARTKSKLRKCIERLSRRSGTDPREMLAA